MPITVSVLTISTTNIGRPRRAPRASIAVSTARSSFSCMKCSLKSVRVSTCLRVIGSIGGRSIHAHVALAKETANKRRRQMRRCPHGVPALLGAPILAICSYVLMYRVSPAKGFFLRRRWLRVRCAPACNKERANAVIQPNSASSRAIARPRD
jgi:hypothetical protein